MTLTGSTRTRAHSVNEVRNSRMRPKFLAGALVLAGLLVGCGKDDGGAKTYAEMAWEDVVVQVNDHKLRKGEMEEFWRMNLKMVAAMPKQERAAAQRRVAQDMLAYPRRFIDRALLVDEAKRLKVLTESQATVCSEILLSALAKSKGMTKDEFFAKYSDSIWYHRKVAEARTWIDALTAKEIRVPVDVTPQVVSNYLGLIAEETAASQATNRANFAMLERLREDVRTGRAVFTNVADRISVDDWDVGEVTRRGFDASATVRAAIFKAEAGEVVGPFEDQDGYELYQVAKITPSEKDSQGREVQPESRSIYRIEIAKADEPVQMDFKQAEADFNHQMLMAAINRRLELLKTNGVNRIVWPHGKHLWDAREGAR